MLIEKARNANIIKFALSIYELLDKIVNAIDSVGLSVELNAQQAEQFFDEETTSTQEKSSEWKKIPLDETNIPQGSKKNERKDDEKSKRAKMLFFKLKLQKAFIQ